jgi:predicted phosphodiesterase
VLHTRAALRSAGLILVFLLLATPVFAGAPLRVAVISDLNGSYGSTDYEASVKRAVARILELKPDLVISTGDMVAGQRRPHLERPEVERMWKAFHAHVSDPLAAAGIPLAVTPGNHDGSAYRGFEQERSIYREQWRPRSPAVRFVDEAEYPFYYAIEVGDILFISLDATTVGHLPHTQMDWLRQILAKHGPENRQRVIFSHVPLWPFTQGREREFIGDPELEALLLEAGVGLYLSGHHHAFYPGVKDGIALVSQSCLGAGPRRLIGAASRSERSFSWLEFKGNEIRIAAYREPGFESEIDWATLPRQIHTPAGDMVRADLVPGDIAPIEPAGLR